MLQPGLKGDEHGRDLLGIRDDRFRLLSTLVTSQHRRAHWHELIGDPTLVEVILDRLIHNPSKITLKGESVRKQRDPLPQTGQKKA